MSVELDGSLDAQAELATPHLRQTDRHLAFVEPALEEHETALEVVVIGGKLQRGIESHLTVREVGSTLLLILGQQPPEDPARHPFDDILAVDEVFQRLGVWTR